MAHIGPNCHEICPKCFELLSPIEEKSVGHIIAPEGAVGSISKCDLCKEGYSRAKGHHIDADRAELLKEYVQRSLKKGFEENGFDAPYSEEEHMKIRELAEKFLTKVLADHLPTPEVTVKSDPNDPTIIVATATIPGYMLPKVNTSIPVNEWQEHLFEDIEFHVRVRLLSEYVMGYEVRPLIMIDDGDGPPYKFQAREKDGVPENYSKNLEEGDVYVRGEIKWDGCSHNYFQVSDEHAGYIHACSRKEMVRFGELFNRLFDLAMKHMPRNKDYLT